jgi:hypothetical protein
MQISPVNKYALGGSKLKSILAPGSVIVTAAPGRPGRCSMRRRKSA